MDPRNIKIEIPLDEILRNRLQIYNSVPNGLFRKAVEFINVRVMDYWEARAFDGGEEFITEMAKLALMIRLHGITESDIMELGRKATVHQAMFEVVYDITTDFISYFGNEITAIINTLVDAGGMFHGIPDKDDKQPKVDAKFWIFQGIGNEFLSKSELRNYLICNPWLVTILLFRHLQVETISFVVEGSRNVEAAEKAAEEKEKGKGGV